MKIEVLDEAGQDLQDGFHFYESQSEGLGDSFLDSVLADIESLRLYAGSHSVYFGYHRLLAKRFPFAVYYRLADETIQIWAVLDCRRNPVQNLKRLSGE